MSEDYTQAEVVRSLKRIEEGQTKLEQKIDDLSATYVQKEAYETRIGAVERDIKGIKEDSKPAKVSGWMIAGFVVSALVGVGSLLGTAIALIKVVTQLP